MQLRRAMTTRSVREVSSDFSLSNTGALDLSSVVTLPGTLAVAGNVTLGGDTTKTTAVNGALTAIDAVGATLAGADQKGVVLRDETAFAAGVGAHLSLGGKYTAGGAYADGCSIKAYKADAVDGNYGFHLGLSTVVNGGAVTERLRIRDDGGVGVGNAGAAAVALYVSGGGRAFNLVTTGGGLTRFETDVEAAGKIGFYGTAAVAKPTGVAVTAAAIHAALVTLGLIAA